MAPCSLKFVAARPATLSIPSLFKPWRKNAYNGRQLLWSCSRLDSLEDLGAMAGGWVCAKEKARGGGAKISGKVKAVGGVKDRLLRRRGDI